MDSARERKEAFETMDKMAMAT